MNKKIYKVSVVVIMYNPIPEKLWLTLNSLIHQEIIDLEIVITDDGSENNFSNEIKQFMMDNCFTNYKLILHEDNKGTVSNCYDGVIQASGDYIKLISPGDFLSNNEVLYQWIDHMIKGNKSWSFGEAVYYIKDVNYRVVSRETHPQNISPYLKQNETKCRWNYLVLDDIALGAAVISERDLLLKYLKRIVNRVRYAEDNIYRLMMFDGVVADYYPNNVIFYECDTGISTAGNSRWKELLLKDWTTANIIMTSNTCCEDGMQVKIKKQMMKKYPKNKIIKAFTKSFVNGWIVNKIKNLIKPRLSDSNCDLNLNIE